MPFRLRLLSRVSGAAGDLAAYAFGFSGRGRRLNQCINWGLRATSKVAQPYPPRAAANAASPREAKPKEHAPIAKIFPIFHSIKKPTS